MTGSYELRIRRSAEKEIRILPRDVTIAKNVSRAIALTMLFAGGLALGRYAGYGSWKAGLLMTGLGALLVGAIRALGG